MASDIDANLTSIRAARDHIHQRLGHFDSLSALLVPIENLVLNAFGCLPEAQHLSDQFMSVYLPERVVVAGLSNEFSRVCDGLAATADAYDGTDSSIAAHLPK